MSYSFILHQHGSRYRKNNYTSSWYLNTFRSLSRLYFSVNSFTHCELWEKCSIFFSVTFLTGMFPHFHMFYVNCHLVQLYSIVCTYCTVWMTISSLWTELLLAGGSRRVSRDLASRDLMSRDQVSRDMTPVLRNSRPSILIGNTSHYHITETKKARHVVFIHRHLINRSW